MIPRTGTYIRSLTVALLALGCVGAGASEGGSYHAPELVLFFDPTVLEPSETTERDEVLADLRNLLMTVTFGARASVYLIGRSSDNRPAYRPLEAPVITSVNDRGTFSPRLGSKVDSLIDSLRSAWVSAHSDSAFGVPMSCVLGSVKTLSDHLGGMDSTTRVYGIVVSDLVEACDDYGPLLFEGGVGSLKVDTTRFASDNLSRLRGLYVLRVKHKAYHRPDDVRALETLWRGVFAAAHASLDPARFLLGRQFPQTPGWLANGQ